MVTEVPCNILIFFTFSTLASHLFLVLRIANMLFMLGHFDTFYLRVNMLLFTYLEECLKYEMSFFYISCLQ